MTDLAITRRSNKIKRDLLDNLRARGLDDTAYTDMVNEYVSLWIIKEQLNQDIDKRGAVIFDERKGICDNPCITKRIQISQQMTKIYKSLGFEAASIAAKVSADGDDLW